MNDRIEKFIYFAKEDMISAKILLKEGIYNQACFHCQQAAEKTLKSFVKAKKGLVPKTHNLTDLPGKKDAEKAVQLMEAIYDYVVKISKQHSCTLKER